MKPIILMIVGLAGLLVAFTPFQVVTKHTVSAAAPIANVNNIFGKLTAISNADSCSAFLNMSTVARTQAGVGIPLVKNTPFSLEIPSKSTVSFTCLSTAGDRSVRVVR